MFELNEIRVVNMCNSFEEVVRLSVELGLRVSLNKAQLQVCLRIILFWVKWRDWYVRNIGLEATTSSDLPLLRVLNLANFICLSSKQVGRILHDKFGLLQFLINAIGHTLP